MVEETRPLASSPRRRPPIQLLMLAQSNLLPTPKVTETAHARQGLQERNCLCAWPGDIINDPNVVQVSTVRLRCAFGFRGYHHKDAGPLRPDLPPLTSANMTLGLGGLRVASTTQKKGQTNIKTMDEGTSKRTCGCLRRGHGVLFRPPQPRLHANPTQKDLWCIARYIANSPAAPKARATRKKAHNHGSEVNRAHRRRRNIHETMRISSSFWFRAQVGQNEDDDEDMMDGEDEDEEAESLVRLQNKKPRSR